MARLRLLLDPLSMHLKLAFKDCAVEAACHALADPWVDIDTWEFASSFAPYVWSLDQIEFGGHVYYILGLGETRQNVGVWL